MAIAVVPKAPGTGTGTGFCLPNVRTYLEVTGTTGDSPRIKVKTAPEGSSYYREDGSEVPIGTTADFPGRDGLRTIEFIPDISGKFTLIVEDVDAIPDRQPSYNGSPNQEYPESILSRTEVDLFVSSKMVLQVGTSEHSADCILYVNNDSVHETTVEEYGAEVGDSPRLDNFSTLQAKEASEALTTTPSDLIGLTLYQLTGYVALLLEDWAQKLYSHFGNGTAHNNIDPTNLAAIEAALTYPGSTAAQLEALSTMIGALTSHAKNDGYNSAGSVHDYPDLINVPEIQGNNSVESLINLMADLYRKASDHFTQTSFPASHGSPDATVLDEPGTLVLLAADFLNEIQSPSTPSRANPLALHLMTYAGFTKEV